MNLESMYRIKECNCGSGLMRYPLSDARELFCAYVCKQCVAKVKAGYRPDIFDDADYDADEQIEPDDSYDGEGF
jgi:hypothetical protein